MTRSLSEHQVHPDPIIQFQHWFAEATAAGVAEPSAMILATVSPGGMPSARAVLLKGVGPDGFRFYTNHHSRKGIQLRQNNAVALVFLWHELERQVRIEGKAERLSCEESSLYFSLRPRGSQISAYVSPQSQVIPDRDYLEDLKKRVEQTLQGLPVPMPQHWGGYLVRPHLIEFWQGMAERLHDRLQFRKVNGRWMLERLAP